MLDLTFGLDLTLYKFLVFPFLCIWVSIRDIALLSILEFSPLKYTLSPLDC